CASIPAPYRERGQMAYATGLRICDMVREDLRPSRILTREAFENAIVVASALGASSNCPPHLIAMARHAGIDLSLDDWQRLGEDVPLLVNCVPAGEHLGEGFHRAGGVPAVMHELLAAGRLHADCATVSGKTIGEIAAGAKTHDADVIRGCDAPLKHRAGFIVLSGNFFD
ncbi:dihydroxy-acid dehydratase, partial [Achromobacter xylosoxidans]|nr:dihydroxy-acid dehydratase [Achromobacter xylosoxidans]MCH1999900.1 dihydroxy-acid dehydratase [Achromobacter xylosoxidans]